MVFKFVLKFGLNGDGEYLKKTFPFLDDNGVKTINMWTAQMRKHPTFKTLQSVGAVADDVWLGLEITLILFWIFNFIWWIVGAVSLWHDNSGCTITSLKNFMGAAIVIYMLVTVILVPVCLWLFNYTCIPSPLFKPKNGQTDDSDDDDDLEEGEDKTLFQQHIANIVGEGEGEETTETRTETNPLLPPPLPSTVPTARAPGLTKRSAIPDKYTRLGSPDYNKDFDVNMVSAGKRRGKDGKLLSKEEIVAENFRNFLDGTPPPSESKVKKALSSAMDVLTKIQ
jgi:hypothetical protein